jgi:hypothetical protein
MICIFKHRWDFWEFTGYTNYCMTRKSGKTTDLSTLEMKRTCSRCGKSEYSGLKSESYGAQETLHSPLVEDDATCSYRYKAEASNEPR